MVGCAAHPSHVPELVPGYGAERDAGAQSHARPSVGEVKKGLVKLPESNRRERLTLWLNTLLDDYEDRILPVDLAVCENWGILQGHAEQAGRPMASIDGLLAATAHTHNMTLITRNERDFAPSHIPVVNPWHL